MRKRNASVSRLKAKLARRVTLGRLERRGSRPKLAGGEIVLIVGGEVSFALFDFSTAGLR
jgi:hypothetical protein